MWHWITCDVMFQVEATDADSGENRLLTYTIVSVNEEGQGRFELDPETGMLYATQQLERHQTFQLIVQAQDQATPQEARR